LKRIRYLKKLGCPNCGATGKSIKVKTVRCQVYESKSKKLKWSTHVISVKCSCCDNLIFKDETFRANPEKSGQTIKPDFDNPKEILKGGGKNMRIIEDPAYLAAEQNFISALKKQGLSDKSVSKIIQKAREDLELENKTRIKKQKQKSQNP
jgi:hypothetical protein